MDPEDDMFATASAAHPLTPVPRPAAPPRADDRRLAAGCAAGETGVFEDLYLRYGDRLKSIAFNHLGNVADAEDAVQETFIKLHRAASSYTGQAAFSTWLYRILVNTCFDALRRRRRRIDEAPMDDFVTASRAAATVDDTKRIALRKLLDGLPEQRRSVFVLFEIEGLTHAEIGQILDITEGNSKWILFSTKKQLQEQWKKSQ
jgi:RNA polymerase sigma-70 factor (ECF subfamily)